MAVEWQGVLVLLGPSAQLWGGCRNSCWAQVNSLSFADLRAIGVSEWISYRSVTRPIVAFL